MADFITQFAADEGVSRQNFNNRITQANTALSTAQSAAAAAQTTANTAVTNAAAANTAADNAAAAAATAKTTADGKAPASHTHTAGQVTAGTLGGKVLASDASVADLGAPQVRNIIAGTGVLTPGVSVIQTGMLYLQYE